MLPTIPLPTLSATAATRHPLGPDTAYEAHVRASLGAGGSNLLSDADEVLLPAILCPRLAVDRRADLTSARVTTHVVAGD